MNCEYCDSGPFDEKQADEKDVNLYVVAKVPCYCCADCLEGNIPVDSRTPVNVPDGWKIVESIWFRDLKKANAAFDAAAKVMNTYADDHDINRGYNYELSGLFNRIIASTETRQQHDKELRKRLGIDDIDNRAADLVSGAYCPSCCGPLLKTNRVSIKHAILYAAASLDIGNFDAKDYVPRKSFVCLKCQTSYVEK
ncbi:hypothetical protein LCGC14_2732290 [marine sediment metagenome]|uniref:Uncharacterized protein n=1 Tax=marine sediment metagenome TaxID=412755 RepID=A0A0F8Z6Y9_9ZZZZ